MKCTLQRPLARLTLACLLSVSLAALFTRAAEPEKKSFPVYSVREFELKPDTNEADFDAFVHKDMADLTGLHGLRIRVLKGDRGERKGHYLLIWEFESVADRNN